MTARANNHDLAHSPLLKSELRGIVRAAALPGDMMCNLRHCLFLAFGHNAHRLVCFIMNTLRLDGLRL